MLEKETLKLKTEADSVDSVGMGHMIVQAVTLGTLDLQIRDIARACVDRRSELVYQATRAAIKKLMGDDPVPINRKIAAIKLWRDITHDGLAESKRAVEAIMEAEGF